MNKTCNPREGLEYYKILKQIPVSPQKQKICEQATKVIDIRLWQNDDEDKLLLQLGLHSLK